MPRATYWRCTTLIEEPALEYAKKIITEFGGDGIGLYADKNLNAGGFVSAAGGAGVSTPGFAASVGLDFYSYNGRVAPHDFINGTSVSHSLQLGIMPLYLLNCNEQQSATFIQ